jgi:sterol desaturase/sphingolipid hydroxylase (fatty acid hydroxylase superfamily)
MESLPHSPWLIALLAAVIVVEVVWRRQTQRSYDLRAAAASLGIAAGNLVLKPIAAILPALAFLWAELATPIHLPLDDWRVWVVGFFAVEFAYYWFHRWSHTIRWMWASHAVHHSAGEFTLPAAVRLGWTSVVSGGWLVFVPLILVGFSPVMVSILLAANLIYQFFLHTEAVKTLGPLEWLLNTPAHHRVHHASNPAYIDRNFGGVLIIYDRLFGTFAALDPADPIRYGLTAPVNSQNVFAIAFCEWRPLLADLRQAPNWRARFTTAFGRPV